MSKLKLPDFIAFITIIPNPNPSKTSQTSSTISLHPDVRLPPSETARPPLTLFPPSLSLYYLFESRHECRRKSISHTRSTTQQSKRWRVCVTAEPSRSFCRSIRQRNVDSTMSILSNFAINFTRKLIDDAILTSAIPSCTILPPIATAIDRYHLPHLRNAATITVPTSATSTLSPIRPKNARITTTAPTNCSASTCMQRTNCISNWASTLDSTSTSLKPSHVRERVRF